MSIRNQQLQRITNEIIEHHLIHGRAPTKTSITYSVSRWLQVFALGAPTFRFAVAENKKRISIESINQSFFQLRQDLNDLRDSVNQQAWNVFSFAHEQEIEQKQMLMKKNRLADEWVRMQQIFKHPESFTEWKTIDAYDLIYTDLAETTAFVDLRRQEICLSESDLQPPIHSSAIKSIVFKHANGETIALSKDKLIHIEQSEWNQIEAGSNEDGYMGAFEIVFENATMLNRIEMDWLLTDFALIEVIESEQVVGQGECKAHTKIEIAKKNYESLQVQIKASPANPSNALLSSKNWSFRCIDYQQEGMWTSEPIVFKQPMKQICLVTDDFRSKGSAIDYEISAEFPGLLPSQRTWQRMVINQVSSIGKQVEEVVMLNGNDFQLQTVNGKKLFQLQHPNQKPISNKSGVLFKGINQYKREKTYVPFEGEMPTVGKWNEVYRNQSSDVHVAFQHKQSTLQTTARDGHKCNFYRFSFVVYASMARLQPMKMYVPTFNGYPSAHVLAYCNQRKCISEQQQVLFDLKSGWNEIQLCYHFGQTAEKIDLPVEQIPAELFTSEWAIENELHLRAEYEPMQIVHLETLLYRIKPNDFQFAAVHDGQIVIHFAPKNILFQYIIEDVDSSGHDQFRIRAWLSKNEDMVQSPIIRSITLLGK